MAERPVTTEEQPDGSPREGSWRVPDAPGLWRTPEPGTARGTWRSPETAKPRVGWRVPTLPQNLTETPEQSGTWHLPKPEHTSISAADESVITEPPPAEMEAQVIDIIPLDDVADEAIEAPLPFDDSVVAVLPPEDLGGPIEAAVEAAADQEAVLPHDDVGVDKAAAEPLTLIDEEDDDDTFSMSELVALASLVEGAGASDAAAEAEAEEEAEGDAAAYAREQLARLQGAAEAEAAPEAAIAEPEAPAAPPLTEQERALAAKFQQAEQNIRALRARYQAGELTRDQLQAELRGQMVLDDDQSWWMMGVESDNWYHFENGQWVLKTPPVLEKLRAAEMGAAAGDLTQPTAAIGDGYEMPLPRAVPVYDPDHTIPGTEALYLEDDPSRTIARDPDLTMVSPAVSQETVANYVEAPAAPDVVSPPSYEEPAEISPDYEQVVKEQRKRTLRTLGVVAAVAVGLFFITAACGIIGIVLYYQSLAAPFQDQIAALANYQPRFQTARIYAADDSVIAELIEGGAGDRRRVSLSDISPYMIHATVSIENERFFDDPGWDPFAIIRAFLQNFLAGEVQSGASTITQQIARNLVLQDATITPQRKLQEIVIAAEIARRYDKNFILELYLNEFFFGNQSYGVEAAAQFYFGVSAADLNLPQAALLAGLLQAPARYDPVVNREASFARMETVLNQQARVGCLRFQHPPYVGQNFCVTQQDLQSGQVILQRAQVETRNFSPRDFSVRYPHFVNYIQAQIEQNFGTAEMFRRGFQIYTTLNPRLQDIAQNSLTQTVANTRTRGANTGAVFVVEPGTGAIRVMVGSPDFYDNEIDGQVNNVFTWQQPGSSIKPVVYTAALEGVNRGGGLEWMTPATILWDVDTVFPTNPPFRPVNFDRQFRGPVALRFALGNSYNVPAVKAFEFIGVDRFRETADRMGLRFLDDALFGLASALGANEVRLYDHAQVYTVIANGGQRVPFFAIRAITDAQGNPIDLPARPGPSQVVQPQIAFLMQNILSDNNARSAAFGPNSLMNIPEFPGLVGAKTGTSNDNRDLWTMGFSSNFVVGVWIGSLNNQPTTVGTDVTALPVWNTVMRAALQGTQPRPFNPPSGIVQQQVCSATGAAFDPSLNQPCGPVRTELFLASQPPPSANASFVQTVQIDAWTGMRANMNCPDNVTTGTFVNINDPFAIQWINGPGAGWAASIGLSTPVQPIPSAECTPGMEIPQVRISSPVNGQEVQNIVQVQGIVSASNLNRYELAYAGPTAPDNFITFAGPVTAQANGLLGEWNTTILPNGPYRIRLQAFSNAGGVISNIVQVNVNNPLPTPTPTQLPPTPTFPAPPTFDPIATPIPFDTPIPFGELSNIGGPTPTIDFGG